MVDEIKEIMIRDVELKDTVTKELVSYMPEHAPMLATIKDNMPMLVKHTSFFGKSQSQFMNNMLTVSHPTPLRNLRQILSEMQTTKQAIQEAYFKNRKKVVEIRMKMEQIAKDHDPNETELHTIELEEMQSQLESSKLYLSGAIRKMAGYIDQYNSIMKEKNITDFNEYDFESEEERYHIMKAFEQAITSARPRGGTVDEGNQIYFAQIGINGATAQAYIRNYLLVEDKILAEGKEPSHSMFIKFLNDMADKFQGSAAVYAKAKGMTGEISQNAILLKGDDRMIQIEAAEVEKQKLINATPKEELIPEEIKTEIDLPCSCGE